MFSSQRGSESDPQVIFDSADLREKINAESDNARQTALRREIEAKTFQERIDRLVRPAPNHSHLSGSPTLTL